MARRSSIRVVAILISTLFSGMAMAEVVDVTPLLGKTWYGLYLHGKKAGYSFTNLQKEADGTYTMEEEANFRITMAGAKQDLHTYAKRSYGVDGALVSIVSNVEDPAGRSEFTVTINGSEMLLNSLVSGEVKTTTLPRPKESLSDAVKYSRWVQQRPALGDSFSFSTFEPMYEKELDAESTLIGVEERILNGVTTKVYKIQTQMPLLGVDSTSFVAENGAILEDVVANIITMRLEPETVAKDVTYENDVIVSNAAQVTQVIQNPRSRTSLRLYLRGPLAPDNLYNDERQFVEPSGDGFNFVANQISLSGFAGVTIPVCNEEVLPWTKSTTFIQSDNPRLKAKAVEILGGETDAQKASEKLCHWVFMNMKSSFSARLSNALEVLEHLEGDCTEHSTLFIGLARAAGIPAREVAGLIYVDGPPPGFYFHQWAKVWVGKWIDVDPTFNQPLADVTHIKLAEGDLFRQARIIPMIGNIQIEVLPETAPAAPAN